MSYCWYHVLRRKHALTPHFWRWDVETMEVFAMNHSHPTGQQPSDRSQGKFLHYDTADTLMLSSQSIIVIDSCSPMIKYHCIPPSICWQSNRLSVYHDWLSIYWRSLTISITVLVIDEDLENQTLVSKHHYSHELHSYFIMIHYDSLCTFSHVNRTGFHILLAHHPPAPLRRLASLRSVRSALPLVKRLETSIGEVGDINESMEEIHGTPLVSSLPLKFQSFWISKGWKWSFPSSFLSKFLYFYFGSPSHSSCLGLWRLLAPGLVTVGRAI